MQANDQRKDNPDYTSIAVSPGEAIPERSWNHCEKFLGVPTLVFYFGSGACFWSESPCDPHLPHFHLHHRTVLESSDCTSFRWNVFQLLMHVQSIEADCCLSEPNLRKTEISCVMFLKSQEKEGIKMKMFTILSLGNPLVLPQLQHCTHCKMNTELEIMQRRACRVLHSMEWPLVERHLRTTFWSAQGRYEWYGEDEWGMSS